MSNKNPEPAQSLTDNMGGDIIDSMLTGMAAHLIVQMMFGKSPTIKNVLSMNTLKDSAKYGAAVGIYRRVGSPMINNIMNRSSMGNLMKL